MKHLGGFPGAVKRAVKRGLYAVGLMAPISRARIRYRDRVVRRDTVRLYRLFIRPGDLCFDVGADVGDLSDIMLSLGARVVAVEPQAESISALQSRFHGNRDFMLVPKGLASKVGTAEFLVSDWSDCSSMSREFVDAVVLSGRLHLEECKWAEVRQVPTTTLDELIEEYGMPAFVKIDVEGFEEEVLKGCSHRLRALSFEFTPERLQPALACVELLEKLGPVEFNYTYRWQKRLRCPTWVSGSELKMRLTRTRSRSALAPTGDVYARFIA